MLRPGKQQGGGKSNNTSAGGYGGYAGAGYGGAANSSNTNSAGGGGGGGNNGNNNGYNAYAGYGGGGGGYGVASGGADSYPSYGNPPKSTPASSVSSSASPYQNRRRSSTGSTAGTGGANFITSVLFSKLLWACLLCLALGGTTFYYRRQMLRVLNKFDVKTLDQVESKYDRLERTKEWYTKDSTNARENARKLREDVRRMEQENRDLQKQTSDLKVQLADTSKKAAAAAADKKKNEGGATKEEVEKLKGREKAWRELVYSLQNATAKESRREALEIFGPGPHHVKFEVRVPKQKDPVFFTVEMAPLDKMPHAVHLFLQQVYHELWDNTWFYLNGPHVLQAGPQDWDDESAGMSIKRFVQTNLDKLAFPEYSKEFPHVPWTMGFTGRPGGPDWYINKVDNTATHGPGGQYQHALDEQADPCFAKIVEGQKALEQKVFTAPVYGPDSDYAFFIKEPIEIVSVRLQEAVKTGIEKPEHLKAKKTAPKIPRNVNKGNIPKNP